MLSDQKSKEPYPRWEYLRMRIYDSYLSIGCGGKDREALPVLIDYVHQINQIITLAESGKEPCQLEDGGTYIRIRSLAGFTTQSGWMLIGMLIKDGWFIHKFLYEGSQRIQMIEMLAKLK
jgi:hypothetical protein